MSALSSLPVVDHTLAARIETAASPVQLSSSPRNLHRPSTDLRLDTSQAQRSTLREPVSPLQEADIASLADSKRSVYTNGNADTQIVPVSPLTVSRRPSLADASDKSVSGNEKSQMSSKLNQDKGGQALVESGTMTPVDRPITPGAGSTTPAPFAIKSVHPPPAYIAESGAVGVVAEHQAEKLRAAGEVDGVQPELTFSPGALALINAFLDYILYNCLSHARSTSLTALRPAITEVLQRRLARDAIASAEEELRELLAGNAEEEDVNDEQDAAESHGQWDLDMVWRRTRLRVMVYTRLGEIEDEDEERFVNEDDLFHVNDRRFSRSTGLVSWAAAIFLTAILEFLAEQALQSAGQAAYTRAQREAKASESAHPLSSPAAVVVEEHDAEKIAVTSSLSRLWRVWRKTQRSGGSSRSGIRFPSSRSGAISPVSTSGSTADTSQSLQNGIDEDRTLAAAQADPADIALPMGDEQRDIDEIEVPGLATDPDAIVAAEMLPAARRHSFVIHPKKQVTSSERSAAKSEGATKPLLVRQRSMSVPTPMRSVLVDRGMPGASPASDEEASSTTAGDDHTAHENTKADAAPAKEAMPQSEAADDGVNKDTTSTAKEAIAVDSAPTQDIHAKGADAEPMPCSKDETNDPVATEIRQSPKTLGKLDKPTQRHIAAVATASASAAALTAAVAAHKSDNLKSSTNNGDKIAAGRPHHVEELDKVKSLAGIKATATANDLSREPSPSANTNGSAGKVKKSATSSTSVLGPHSAVPRHVESSNLSLSAKKSAIPEFPVPHSRSGFEYSQVTAPRESLTPPHSQPASVDVEEDKAFDDTKIDSVHSDSASARDVQATLPARKSARSTAAAPAPSVPRSHLQTQKSNEKLRFADAKDEVGITNIRAPVTDTEDLDWPSPPPGNAPAKTTVRILPPPIQTQVTPQSKSTQTQTKTPTQVQPQTQDGQQSATNTRARQKATSPYSAPSVSRIPETEVPRESYFPSQPQSPSRQEAILSSALTSAAIRGPEDFDDFVQNSETVKYTLTPDNIRDDLQKDRTFLRKHSIDQTEYRAKVNGSVKSPSPSLAQDARMSRSSVSKSNTPITSPTEEWPRSPRSVWPLNKEKRRSNLRPEPRNTDSHRKSGLMAREPRVQTDSIRDFADFIRSTGPKPGPEVAIPTRSLQAARSTTSLQSHRNFGTNGLKSVSRDSLPTLPNGGATRTKSNLQPRSPTVVADANSDLIDFIRSGPAQAGEHRIPRTVAPFRSTMDSDDFTEWTDKINTTPPVGDGRSISNGYAQPTYNISAPAVKSVFKNDSGRTQYRNKDPYASYWDDDEDYRETMISALPKDQQAALSKILSGNAPLATTTAALRPPTSESFGAPPVRTISQGSRFSGYRNRVHAENQANTRDLISFLNAGPGPSVDNSITSKSSLASIREDYNDSRPVSKQSKTKRGFFGFGRR